MRITSQSHFSNRIRDGAFIALALLFIFSLALPRSVNAATVIYLTSGTSWTVPSDWNSSNNTIEVIGGGGAGGNQGYGGGGGGGAYSKAINVTLSPGASVSYAVGSGGSGGNGLPGTAGGDSYFCNSTSNCTSISGSSVVAGAKGGAGGVASGGAGGSSTSGVGSTKFSGGNGAGYPGGNVYAGGGGGAAGRFGAGINGSASGSTGVGGSGDSRQGGSGGSSGSGVGGSGAEWDATHGSGGGGGGNSPFSCANGGAGGLYGGGGGGAICFSYSGGAGKQGIIVITNYDRSLVFNGSVQFKSTLNVGGALTKGSGTFVIDHPLDPKNTLLFHSFVESPDAKNIYDGIAKLDKNGEVRIFLPPYFDALNTDVRYQWLAMYQAMPNLYIKEEEHDNQFVIAGGPPGGQVSWQITGIRRDPYILMHPIMVEVLKGPGQIVDKGKCLFEILCK